jgi:hypothetical protein
MSTVEKPALAVKLRFELGPLAGLTYPVKCNFWPPPDRLFAGDFMPGAVGSYLRCSHTAEPVEATYRLRADQDYIRIASNALRIKLQRRRIEKTE